MNKRALVFVICCSLVFFLVLVFLAVFVPNINAKAEDNARIDNIGRIDDIGRIDESRDTDDSSESYFRLKNLRYVFEDERHPTRADASFTEGYIYVLNPHTASDFASWYAWYSSNTGYKRLEGYLGYETPVDIQSGSYWTEFGWIKGQHANWPNDVSTSTVAYQWFARSVNNNISARGCARTELYEYGQIWPPALASASTAPITDYPWYITSLASNEKYFFITPKSYNFGSSDQVLLNALSLFFILAYTGEVDNTPILSADTIDIDFNTYYMINELEPTAYNDYTAKGYKVVNASDYLDNNGVCAIDYYYTYVESGETTVYSGTMDLVNAHGEYYLVMLLPAVHAGNSAFSFADYGEYYTIDNTSNFNTTVKNAFVQNGSRWLALMNLIGNGFYQRGYAQGYNVGYTEQNNLLSVMWATFNMPIRILFGTYDFVTDSYSGGLFTFTIFGLDVRAFVLGILSLVLVIRIISVVLGGKHNG